MDAVDAGETYPAGPKHVPPDLTRPTGGYRLHVYLALAGLLVFVAGYFVLASWFAWTSYRLFAALQHAPDHWIVLVLGGGASGFLALFMFKAVFFIRRGKHDETSVEVTARDHPALFAFLHRLADEAGAPRPHRVFLSPHVNASVFYDLSLANLILRSRKNLEIGLGLVNVLTIGELKAVLAHEFGHFAQRSMALGRWVYVAQQITGHIVVRRDSFDRALHAISSWDFRIAWIGWVMRIIVWSLRSLIDSVFRWVVLAQRALGREMELQADLVAVSLTGSDSLVHALHRLDAADDAMERAFGFAASRRRMGKQIVDLFAVQSEMLAKKRAILDDPSYGQVPPLPSAPELHRLFRAQVAHPPRMWSTHPPNDVREDNAKKIYVPAPLDDRSSWILFKYPARVRQRITETLFEGEPTDPTDEPLEKLSVEDALADIAQSFDSRFFDPSYRGAYLGRSIARYAASVDQLYAPLPDPAKVVQELDALYPPRLTEDLAKARELSEELDMLRALEAGILESPGGIVRFRGREHRRRDLPRLVADVDAEVRAATRIVEDHDRRVRSAHLVAAREAPLGWEQFLRGLLSIVHYANHRAADLDDAMGSFDNVLSIVTVDRKVTDTEMERLLGEARDLHTTLSDIYGEASQLELGALADKIGVESWQQMLGDFELGTPSAHEMGAWLEVLGSWVSGTKRALDSLAVAALDELLQAEHAVAQYARARARTAAGMAAVGYRDAGDRIAADLLPDAPDAPRAPPRFRTLLPGKERPRQTKLGWWDRFQIADGFVSSTARLAVAGTIVFGVVWAGRSVGESTVIVVNALSRPVVVSIADRELEVSPADSRSIVVDSNESYEVETRTTDGTPIESFTADVDADFATFVYSVAAATPLVEMSADETRKELGAPRWLQTRAERVDFGMRISVYGSEVVLAALGAHHPWEILPDDKSLRDAIVAARARWEPATAHDLDAWLEEARTHRDIAAILETRFAIDPIDVVARRLEQDIGPRADVCARHREAATNAPDEPAWQYLALRCIDDVRERQARIGELATRWPTHPWIALATSSKLVDEHEYDRALHMQRIARDGLPQARETIATRLVRLERLAGMTVDDDALPPRVAALLKVDAGNRELLDNNGYMRAVHLLHLGKPDAALSAAKGTDWQAAIEILVGASDEANADHVRAALAIPVEHVEADVALYAAALAIRDQRDAAPLLARMHEGEHPEQLAAFFKALPDPKAAEPQLVGLDLATRARAYAAAAVVLGKQCPPAWREIAKKALFIVERPWLE